MLREVPVVGQLTQAFDALREAVTGERVELERNTAAVKQADEAWQTHAKAMADGKRATDTWLKSLRELQDRLKIAYAPPETRASTAAAIEGKQALDALKGQYEKAAGIDAEGEVVYVS